MFACAYVLSPVHCFCKVFFEVHILEHLPVDFGEDHQEQDPHVVRVGWSIDSSSFQLGWKGFVHIFAMVVVLRS